MYGMNQHYQRFLRIACLLLTILHTATVITFTAVFLHLRRSVGPLYSDMLDAPSLPDVTVRLLEMPGWIYIVAAALLIAALIAKDFLRPRSLPLVINLIWIIVGACIGSLLLIALLHPMVFIIEDVTGGAP